MSLASYSLQAVLLSVALFKSHQPFLSSLLATHRPPQAKMAAQAALVAETIINMKRALAGKDECGKSSRLLKLRTLRLTCVSTKLRTPTIHTITQLAVEASSSAKFTIFMTEIWIGPMVQNLTKGQVSAFWASSLKEKWMEH